MTLKELGELKYGNWVVLQDGREGVFLEVHEYARKNNGPCVVVNVPNNEGPYSHDDWFWPAQVKGRR